MAASGNTYDTIAYRLRINFGFYFIGLTESTCDLVDFRHVTAMADYALQLFNKIEEVNTHSFNNFRMRIGEFMLVVPF